jgi:transglutaminase/protease-like cytokinesis protein 3
MNLVCKYLISIIILLAFTSNTYSQVKKPIKKNKLPTQQKINPLSFNSEEEFNKWAYQDSLKRAIEDSINYIKDSIETEREFSKIFQENWYPEDSLSYVDKIVEKMIVTNPSVGIDSVAILIKGRFTNSIQKARAVFFWVASTVKYDFDAFNNNLVKPIYNESLDAVNTFNSKKGVCQNFANLYKYLCDRLGIESLVISGSGKNFPYGINPSGESNHAWNAVKIGKNWILLDATWARINTTQKADNYWFGTPAEEFIYSHLPEDSTWQLLKLRITRKQFNNYPIVTPFLFKSKFDFEVPTYGNLVLASNKFSISKPIENKNYSIAYSILPYKGDNWQPYLAKMDEQSLETVVVPDKKNKIVNYQTTIPSKGIWWLKISLIKKTGNEKISEMPFPDVIILRLRY